MSWVAPVLGTVLRLGIPAVAIIITLSYSDRFSGYWVPKTAIVLIMVPLLLGVWMVRAALEGRLTLVRSPLYWPFLLYVVASLASLLWAQNPGRGLEAIAFRACTMAVWILATHHLTDLVQARRALTAVVATGALVSAIGLLQFNGVPVIADAMAYGPGWGSTLGNPNFSAHYLDVLIPVAVALVFIANQVRTRGLGVAAIVLASAYLIVCQSRAGWLAVSVALLFMLAFSGLGFSWLRHAVLAVIILALLSPAAELVGRSVQMGSGRTLSSQTQAVFQRTWDRLLSSFDARDFSLSQRRILWADSWSLVRSSPVLGIGAGNFEIEVAAHRTPDRHDQYHTLTGERKIPIVTKHAHNDYLETWSEVGIPGLVSLLWLLGLILWNWNKALRFHPTGEVRVLGLGAAGAVVATMVHALLSFNFKDPVAATHFWMVAGVLAALGNFGDNVEWSLGSRWKRGLVVALGLVVVGGGSHLGGRMLLSDLSYMAGRSLYLKNARNPQAKPYFDEAVSWRSHDHHYHYMVGHASLNAARLDAATAALRRSLELHPNYKLSLYLQGKTSFHLGRYDESVMHLTHAVSVDPYYEDAVRLLALSHQEIAVSHREAGGHEEAITHWRKALELEPGQPELINGLAVEFRYADRIDEAIRLLENGVVEHPNDGRILGNLGSFYVISGRFVEAEEFLLRALEYHPQDRGFWQNMIAVYQSQGRRAEARRQILRAMSRSDSAVSGKMYEDLLKRVEEGK